MLFVSFCLKICNLRKLYLVSNLSSKNSFLGYFPVFSQVTVWLSPSWVRCSLDSSTTKKNILQLHGNKFYHVMIWYILDWDQVPVCLHFRLAKSTFWNQKNNISVWWSFKMQLLKFEGECTVRLNLINHFVGFIPCQFACNSTLRNHVFRWESCKGSVWESVKKCSRLCIEAETRDWISRVPRDWQATKGCTWVKHAEKLNCHASCSTTRQKVQTGHSVSSQLELATQSSRQLALFWKTDSSHSILTQV